MRSQGFVRTTITLLLILPATAEAQRHDGHQSPAAVQATPAQTAPVADQLAATQSAIQAIADQLKQISGQVGDLRKQVDTFPKNPPLSAQQSETLSQLAARKRELDATSEELAKAASELAKANLDERRDLFDLVKEIFLIAAAMAAAGIGIFEFYSRFVVRNTRADLEKSIRSRILAETLVTTGGMFTRMTFPWWEQYEPQFVAYLRRAYLRGALPAGQATFLREISLARCIIEQGFDFFDEVSQTDAETSAAVRYRAMLNNQWVYHRTAELLCTGEPISAAESNEVFDRAELCLGFSENSKLSGLWYELRQTVAFAFLVLGDARFNPTSPQPLLLQRGRGLLTELFQGHRPVPPRNFLRPPTAWLQKIHDEVFPADPATNAPVDVFGLGAIARP
jgi:hypothetical protein